MIAATIMVGGQVHITRQSKIKVSSIYFIENIWLLIVLKRRVDH